ncbi:hypothetical protein V6N12_041041 [Hibiscus sabdariffa]|uniref:Alpha-amylase n=1 Tax=Hibiscus sabdariffa TaxID=183260 RepID=A0ABR2E5Y5_9ROSI
MSEDNIPDPAVCLHGDLVLKIIEARSLPNMDLLSDRLRRCFTPFDPFSKRKKNHRTRKIVTSDPYVTVCLAGATVARTRVISNSQDPIWNERFKIPLAHPANQFEFYIKDNDVFGADLIGVATVQAADVLAGEMIRGWFPIISSHGKPPKTECALHLEMKFTKCEEMPVFKNGNAVNPNGFGIGNCYFPARHGGSVTLYQDAHVMESMLPEIELENGTVFKHEPCWEEICHAILEAHHLVYITGWSVFHEVKLVREPTRPLPHGGDLSLGDLLKYKSEEGVRVLVLVWDDKTSHSKFFINTAGVMQTHDEETRKFFRHTAVTCVLSPRYASRGLDLCDGRYDTPKHRLFRDLDTVYKDDFHNPTYSAGIRCPREPWHDLHCKVEGPAAYDVLTNFEQRWRKATKWAELGRRLKRGSKSEESLLKLDRISWILSPSQTIIQDDPSLWVCSVGDSENWNVQVFRSIDSGSVKGFPKDIYQADAENLVCAKNLVIDRSIQTAYIQAIRAAQHFIYIENQYFIGSSYAWPSYKAGADNLIPMELALKITSKIRAKERFAVYVVIPMWPEGVPTSTSVQEILFWQGQTFKTMYAIIGNELKSMGMEDSHPQDYLNFYCLGRREELPSDYSWSRSCLLSPTGDAISPSLRFQRFMIYVHAKGMIVDDEYVILGSANINQRSMAGSRDTEIAIGACQPHYTWKERKRHPRGQVYGYRMSLWAEHMHTVTDVFKEAGSLECVKTVNDIAEENWKRYSSNEFKHLQGHLLKYPISVTRSGFHSFRKSTHTDTEEGETRLGPLKFFEQNMVQITRGILVLIGYFTLLHFQQDPANVNNNTEESTDLGAVLRNGREILLQGFNWESHKYDWWRNLEKKVPDIAKSGFTSVWLPPATNSFSPEGYLPQNLYSLNSAYGSEQLLKALLQKLKQYKVRAMADIVINHRIGTTQGHGGMYNRYDGIPLAWNEHAVTSCTGGLGNKSTGDNFNGVPNIDHSQHFVRKDIIGWLKWLRNVGFQDFRFDFARGYSAKYVKEYIEEAKPIFSVGECWDSCNYNGYGLDYNQDSHRQRIINWIDATGQLSTAFDFTTKGILQEAVKGQFWRLRDPQGKPPGVVGWWPSRAVTFIDNHDTGSTQAHWPFPSNHIMEGYAYILTHPGIPTVFYDHFYDWGDSIHEQIAKLVNIRKRQDIHSRSSLRILESQNNLYSAMIGDKVCMKIGDGSWCPTGREWTLATSGHRYAVWQKQ